MCSPLCCRPFHAMLSIFSALCCRPFPLCCRPFPLCVCVTLLHVQFVHRPRPTYTSCSSASSPQALRVANVGHVPTANGAPNSPQHLSHRERDVSDMDGRLLPMESQVVAKVRKLRTVCQDVKKRTNSTALRPWHLRVVAVSPGTTASMQVDRRIRNRA